MTRTVLNQQGEPGRYFIHPTDLPQATRYTEKPSRVPDFTRDVFGVTILATVLAAGTSWSLLDNPQAAIGTAGAFGLLVLFWRVIHVYDKPFPVIEDVTYQEVMVITEESERRRIPVNQAGQPNGEIVFRNEKLLTGIVDNREFSHTFSGRQLDRLLAWYDGGYTIVRRDSSAQGPGLDQIGIRGGTYSIVKALLEANEFIDEAGEWTPAGLQWLQAP